MTQENSERTCICRYVGGLFEGVVIVNPDCRYDHGQPSQPAGAAPAGLIVAQVDVDLWGVGPADGSGSAMGFATKEAAEEAKAWIDAALAAERAARERAERERDGLTEELNRYAPKGINDRIEALKSGTWEARAEAAEGELATLQAQKKVLLEESERVVKALGEFHDPEVFPSTTVATLRAKAALADEIAAMKIGAYLINDWLARYDALTTTDSLPEGGT